MISWELLRLENPFGSNQIEPFPFFIRWAEDSGHPSTDSPPGCELISLQIEHPDAEKLALELGRFGIEADVIRSEQPGLTAKLRTPKGTIELK